MEIYEARKKISKEETLQKLYNKKEEEKALLEVRKIKRSDLKKQIIYNFNSKLELKKHTKGKKIL